MTERLFAYPKNAFFGRVLPKNKIYEHARPGQIVKDLFIRQVEQITWQYKLAPETVNLKAMPLVPEIQIFRMLLKEKELKSDVLRCVDEAIPFPILFELRFSGKVKSIAAYKRPIEAGAPRWIISDYFESRWVSDDAPRKPLPVVSDLGALYGHLLVSLMPYPARPGESIQAQVERMGLIHLKKREMARYEARIRKEKQFNRKIGINAELRDLRKELEILVC